MKKLNERIDELATVLNQSKECIQIYAPTVKQGTQLGGSLEEAEEGINLKDSIITEIVEWMSDKLDRFRKADGVCGRDLLYATRK